MMTLQRFSIMHIQSSGINSAANGKRNCARASVDVVLVHLRKVGPDLKLVQPGYVIGQVRVLCEYETAYGVRSRVSAFIRSIYGLCSSDMRH